MRNLPLTHYPQPTDAPATFPDHTVFTERVAKINIPEHRSNRALICVLEGAIVVRVNRISYDVAPGFFVIVDAGSSLVIRSGASCRPFVLCFGSDVNQADEWQLAERLHAASAGFMDRALALADLRETCSSFLALRSEAVLRSIINDIVEFSDNARTESLQLALKKKSTREENYKRMARVRDWLEDNFMEEAPLKKLAQMASLDPRHFMRLFTQLYKKTPRQYIIDRRIDEAKRLLSSTGIAVESICHQVGWESVPSFNTIFKQKAGATPTQFRAAARVVDAD